VGRWLPDLVRAHSSLSLLCVSVIFLLQERETKRPPLSCQCADGKPRAKDVVGSTWRVGAFQVGKGVYHSKEYEDHRSALRKK
jgi:hypothetical protein